MVLYVGLDLSRKRIDFDALLGCGERWQRGAVPADADGLLGLVRRLGDAGQPVLAVIESMSGARFVHDQLERAGWDVRVADAARAKGLAPLACKTDRIDAWVLAELARRELVPEVWLPDPRVRAERERSRFRLHLIGQRTRLKNRVHAVLFQHGLPPAGRGLFSGQARERLEQLALPEPWRATVAASLQLIDQLDGQISLLEQELRSLLRGHPYLRLLQTCPGIGPILAATIAAELGEIERFPSARKLAGYTGLCPRVNQSGERDRRGPLRKNGPRYLRWALIEAAHTASRHPHYQPLVERMRQRHGRRRGSKIASIEIARRLSEAIWWMLSTNTPFAPAGATTPLAAMTAHN